MTLTRPMIEAGRLVDLFDACLKAEYAHYLVYPPRAEGHAGLAAFRDWLLEETRAYLRPDIRAKVSAANRQRKRRK
jgi:LysR family glycine cleavage system transcriptional activator